MAAKHDVVRLERSSISPAERKATVVKPKRFMDLIVPFRRFDYYNPKQMGRTSIESVFPALTSGSYEGLEIGDGGTASNEYARVMFSDGILSQDKECVLRGLEENILKELEKPGRDPRPEFKAVIFREGVENLKDLEPGMMLEGIVINVINFGAFVDIGVHQGGLVHISALANKFVKDPHSIVKAGDVVKVKVLEIDIARKRIALTMCLSDEVTAQKAAHTRQ